jgi:beta-alanine--pyruvate transaminase
MRATTAIRSCGDPRQAAELDYPPAFQFAHPKAFELASRVAALAPGDSTMCSSANSGSEAVDTALKIALAYHNVRGEGARTRLIGRERGYHGVGFGGIAVGGIVNNRKFFGALLAGVDHLPTTYDRKQQAFSKGEPDWGAHLADELERIVALHDASTIAAVIVEPMAGSTGVLPTPKGYLQRLRAICDKHGILLIFDEVITGFGRLGHAFAAERYGVTPDLITFARASRQARADGRRDRDQARSTTPSCAGPSTWSSCSTAIPIRPSARLRGRPGALDLYRAEGLFERAARSSRHGATPLMSLKGLPTCSTSAASGSPPASTWRHGPMRSAGAPMTPWCMPSSARA